jgi:hypothetical protein
MASPILWMIREGSSVDAPVSFEVSLPCTLARHHASHVPCDVFVPRRCFLLQTQAVLSWAANVDGRSATLSTPVFIRQHSATSCFLLRSALFSDSCCSGSMCGCRQSLPSVVIYTGVEALRQLVTMQPWPPSLPAEAHNCRQSPSTYCRAALVPPAVSRLHVFLRSGSSVLHS